MRVLLVEDDENIGDAVRHPVADAGHAIDWVKSLAEARRHIPAIAYDQLLPDLSLPDGDGLELIARMRAVVLRGETMPENVMSAGTLRIDFAARRVVREGQAVSLTSLKWPCTSSDARLSRTRRMCSSVAHVGSLAMRQLSRCAVSATDWTPSPEWHECSTGDQRGKNASASTRIFSWAQVVACVGADNTCSD